MPEDLTLTELGQRLDVPAIDAGLVHPALNTIVDTLIDLERRVRRLEQGREEDRRVPGLL